MACADRGIPVIIMEPLRGGRLANLPKAAARPLRESGLGWSAAELALRWLWDQPQVTCVLSGMNSFEMIDENMRIASSVEAGSFGGVTMYGMLQNGALSAGEMSDLVPEDVREKYQAYLQQMINGTFMEDAAA